MIIIHKDNKIFKIQNEYSAIIYFGKNSGGRINMIGNKRENRIIKIGNNTTIKGSISAAGNLTVGHSCNILGNIYVHKNVRIGNKVTIGPGCAFSEDVHINNKCNIGSRCKFMRRCSISDNVTINSEVHIIERAIIPPFFHIKVLSKSYSYVDLYRGGVIIEGYIKSIQDYYKDYEHRRFYKYVRNLSK